MYSLVSRLPTGIRQTAVYALSLAAMKGVSFVMLPIFTHYLSPEEYGRLDILQTLADLLSVVLAMGLADTLFRFAGTANDEIERKKAAAMVAGMGIASAIVFLVVGQIVAPFITAFLPGEANPLHVRLILASLSLTTAILIPLAWLRMGNHASWYSIGTLGSASLQAGLAALLLWQGYGVTGVLFAALVSALILASTLTWVQWRDTGLRLPQKSELATLLRYSLPLVTAGAAAFVLRSSDRWFVADAIGVEALADYALAQKFGLLTILIVQPFEMWWLSQRLTVIKNSKGQQRAAETAMIGLTLCMSAAMLVATTGPLLTVYMTPETYHGAVVFIPWLAALCALHAATTLMNLGLYTGQNTYLALLIESLTAGLALLLFYFLIPVYGAYGAMASAGGALFLRFLATTILAQRLFPLPISWVLVAVALASGLVGIILIATAESIENTFAICGIVIVIETLLASILFFKPRLFGRNVLSAGFIRTP